MEQFTEIISKITEIVWGLPMIILLLGGGVFLTLKLGFFQFRHLPHILGETLGKMFKKSDHPGSVSPFQATTSALAATMGAANIVGVPVAIALGGPGSIFWMWIVALIGMATKYSEVVLGIRYRETNEKNEYVGGPMYYIRKGLGWKKVAYFFAFALMLEIIASTMVQANSVAETINGSFGISPLWTGLVVMLLVGMVVIGGIKLIGKVTEKLIPVMILAYIAGVLTILIINISEVPQAFLLIFEYAFQPISAAGGFLGAGVAAAIRWGLARGLYSNEAGMGTAPIAHSAARNDHPARQGFWGVFEVIMDTLVVCTMTAMAVLTTGAWKEVGPDSAADMVPTAFATIFGSSLAGSIISLILFFFVITTVLIIVYYGEKQAEFLFGRKFSLFMRYVYLVAIVLGAIGGLKFIWQFLDLLLAMIVIPNMIAVVFLSKQVKSITDDYFRNYLRGEGESKYRGNGEQQE
ncbi:alanine/glycine:cation symporter family protein [Salimicrobium salexigens]|uniref:Alanine or glycine:cation symporter, AGCS family n=1 Tax=Salimicrobium salexigens TaxID=908941 RepID=A0ABY1KZ47_9BACI|nr:sodium:alanine symporter family protein [Salimicrobium salexigens]SIS95706.1 alanine or glycine:cation symporter, AGCS family [Salimicrobium salexigens]